MPTGYTAAIADGITFEQYAMSCARAFGALVTMRDDPSDAPIPQRLEPSDYHLKAQAEAEAALVRLQGLTPEQASAEATGDFMRSLASWEKSKAECVTLRNKYNAMLAKVVQWNPPTPEHEHFKEFMASQLRDSIKWDCSEDYYDKNVPARQSTAAWLAAKLAEARRDVEYHCKNYAEEVERTESRNAWLSALRGSLPPPALSEKERA